MDAPAAALEISGTGSWRASCDLHLLSPCSRTRAHTFPTHMCCVEPSSPRGKIHADKSLLPDFQVLLIRNIGRFYHHRLSGNSGHSCQQLKPFNAEPLSLRRGGFSPSSILASHCKCLSQLQPGNTDACPRPPQSYKG